MLETATEFSVAETPNMARKSTGGTDDLEALDKAMIAGLSPRQISHMTRDELVRVVEGTCLPIATAQCSTHLMCADRRTLERLAYLARRCCRNQGY